MPPFCGIVRVVRGHCDVGQDPVDRAIAGDPRSRSDTQLLGKARVVLSNLLIIILLLILIGALPTWPHSASWGYLPSGAVGIVLLVLLVMVITGRV